MIIEFILCKYYFTKDDLIKNKKKCYKHIHGYNAHIYGLIWS